MILTTLLTLLSFVKGDDMCLSDEPFQQDNDDVYSPWSGYQIIGDSHFIWSYQQRLGRHDGNIAENDTDTPCCDRCKQDPKCTAWEDRWYASSHQGYMYHCELYSCVIGKNLNVYGSRRNWIPNSMIFNNSTKKCDSIEPGNEYCKISNNNILNCYNLTGKCIHYNSNYHKALIPDSKGRISHFLGSDKLPSEVEQYSSEKVSVWYGSYCPSDGYMPYGSIPVHNPNIQDFDFNEFFSDDNDKEFYEQGWFYLLCAIVIIFVCAICVCGYIARRNPD